MTVIDLAAPGSWTPTLREHIDGVVESLERRRLLTPETCANDLAHEDINGHLERATRSIVSDDAFLCYHATRFLPHELEAVRSEGLRPLTHALRRARVENAAAHHPDALPAELTSRLLDGGPFDWQETADVRLGRLWVVAPFTIFAAQRGGFIRLLRDWGGESISWLDGTHDEARGAIAALSAVSSAAIVEAEVPVAALPQQPYLWPLLVGHASGFDSAHQEWALQTDIAGPQARRIILPEDADYPYRV